MYFLFLEDINLKQYIAIYHSTKVAELDRKYLGANLHVPKWLATDWAGIVRTGIILATETVATVKLAEVFPSGENSEEFKIEVPENMLSALYDHMEGSLLER